ncbi:MAG: nitroreductase [Atopobiaceae bacterium]|nr:nitroreductase [Atopobiaceae bacterium]
METLECIRTRRAIRAYKDEPVPEEMLEKILEAGMWAPSGQGKQAATIIAITSKDQRDRLMELNAKVMDREGIDPFYGAPVVLLVIVDKSVGTYANDGELVMENMMLAAHDLGLATCYIWRAKQELETEEGKKMLADWGLPMDVEYEGVGHVILGYAAQEAPEPKPRKADYVYRV